MARGHKRLTIAVLGEYTVISCEGVAPSLCFTAVPSGFVAAPVFYRLRGRSLEVSKEDGTRFICLNKIRRANTCWIKARCGENGCLGRHQNSLHHAKLLPAQDSSGIIAVCWNSKTNQLQPVWA